MIIIFLINCSNILFAQSAKDKFNAINDYLETVKEFSTEKVIIVKEKISSNLTIRLFKVNKIWAIDSMGNGKFDETFYDEKDWKIMNNAYKNRQLTEKNGYLENKYWTINDFLNKDIIFESVKDRSWEIVFKDYYEKPEFSSSVVFLLSEPIYYQNKNYLVFSVQRSGILGGFGSSTLMIAMKRKNHKWVRMYEGYPDWHN